MPSLHAIKLVMAHSIHHYDMKSFALLLSYITAWWFSIVSFRRVYAQNIHPHTHKYKKFILERKKIRMRMRRRSFEKIHRQRYLHTMFIHWWCLLSFTLSHHKTSIYLHSYTHNINAIDIVVVVFEKIMKNFPSKCLPFIYRRRRWKCICENSLSSFLYLFSLS